MEKKLPYLRDYSGETLEQLIGMHGTVKTFSINFAIERALKLRFGYEDSSELSPYQRVILAVQHIQREVMNGGFRQFFFNSSRFFLPYVVDALERIDCPKTANLARQAIATLNSNEIATIEDRVLEHSPERKEALTKLDQQFFKYEEPLDEKLFAWIKANREYIALS